MGGFPHTATGRTPGRLLDGANLLEIEMKKVTVTAYVSRETAIKARLKTYGEIEIEVDPATLTETQRETLARVSVLGTATPIPVPGYPGKTIWLPAVPADIAQRVPEYLDAIAAALHDAAAKYDTEKAVLAERSREAIEKALVMPMGSWVKSGVIEMPGHFYSLEVPADLKVRYDFRRALELAIRDEADAKRRAEDAAKREALRKEEKEEAEAKAAQIAAWVESKGSPSQQARRKRGLLSTDEVVNAIREEAFAPLAEFPRYDKITAEHVEESYGYGYEPRITCSVEDADTATDDQFATLTAIEAAMPGCTAVLRLHQCVPKDSDADEDEAHAVIRHSVLVSIKVGAFEFSREYAA